MKFCYNSFHSVVPNILSIYWPSRLGAVEYTDCITEEE